MIWGEKAMPGYGLYDKEEGIFADFGKRLRKSRGE